MAELRKVLLIDGHGLAYRAFFALPDTLTTADGQPTNAVYGFTSMLLKVLGEERPDAVVVAFDGPRSELRRTKEYPEYKAQRPGMPDDLKSQMSMINSLLEAMSIPVVQVPGYEADDVLGGMARRVADAGDEAVILTGDKDTLQLVGDRVRVIFTGRGITETYPYDTEAVESRYGVPPGKIPEIIGLKGDPSDNIPGVPGIGEKGACALIKEYGSLDNLYAHIDEVTGPKRRETLISNRDTAYLSRDLAVIDTGVPLTLDPGSVELWTWDRRKVLAHLSSLDFQTLARRFVELFGDAGEGAETEVGTGAGIEYSMVDADSTEALHGFEEKVASSGSVAVAAAITGDGYCDLELHALALCTERLALFVSLPQGGPAWDTARRVLESPSLKLVHDGKRILEALGRAAIPVRGVSFDTAIAAYLVDPARGSYSTWDLWQKHATGVITVDGRAEELPEQFSLLADEDTDGEGSLLAAEAARVFHLKPDLAGELRRLEMYALFETVEMPLMHVLEAMEETGVALDISLIRDLSNQAAVTLAGLEEEIFELAGRTFNIGSTKQLAVVLFEDLGLDPVKKTKTGYSTDSSVLESLKNEHPIAQKIIEHREFSKLKSTYLDVLPSLVCPSTGKVHCSFNQTVTTTGRISSSNPNLQNIPVRTEVGRRIRAAFLPGGSGWKMLVADYSQIELRVLAHMSEDPFLLDAFARDADIHTETASLVFGVSADEVTPEMRRVAKMVNFGVVYGMGYYGLSTRLGISHEEATLFIDAYFKKYAGCCRLQGPLHQRDCPEGIRRDAARQAAIYRGTCESEPADEGTRREARG